MQATEFGRDSVVLGIQIRVYIAETEFRGNRELSGIVEPRVRESPLAVHLQVRDQGIPISDRTPASPGVEIDAGQAEHRWDQRGSGFAVWPEGLAVHENFGIELP